MSEQNLQELLAKPNFQAKRPNALLANLIWSLGPILLVALLIYFFFMRQIRIAAKGAGNVGHSTPKGQHNHLKGIIQADPETSGTAIFVGTQVPLQNLIDALEAGESIKDFLARFPTVKREQVIAVVEAGKLKMLETVAVS